MTLKELQGMIKEEFDALQNEAEDVDVSVSDADVDATEGDDSMEMLKKIYDMLKPKFEDMEGNDMDEEMMDEEMDEEMMDEVKDDEKKDEAADMEEAASTGFGDAGAKNTSGKDAGYTPAKTTSGDGKLHEGVKRFQKLANIIK
jgi:hypothetical protein